MHPEWKTIKKGEYLYARLPTHPKATSTGYVLEHRAVMENKIGRYLLPHEVVHHIDENKHNNSPCNLELMTSSEHGLLHNPPGRTFVNFVCPICGITFPKEKRQIKPNSTPNCSRQCGRKAAAIKLQKIAA